MQYFCMVNDGAEGQFDTTASLDIVANVETVALPSDCYEIRAIYIVNANVNAMLRYYNNVSDGYYTANNPASIEGYRPYYYFRQGSIVLRPIPEFSQPGGLLLEYTQFPQTMITGGDQLSSGISPIFKEIVVKYMVYQAKLKEASVMGGDTHKAIEGHLAGLVENFKEYLGGRSKYPQFIKPFTP